MKKLTVILTVLLLFGSAAYAAEVTTVTSATVSSIFSIEFYADSGTDTAIRYDNGQIVFPSIDPALEESMVMTTLSTAAGSDVGVVCRTNTGEDWTLSIRADTVAPFLPTNLAIYKPAVVYDRNTSPATEYTASGGDLWSVSTGADETIFTSSGTGATNSAPFGVLATFSFAILPTGKATPTGQSEIGTGNTLPEGEFDFNIVYTLTAA